MKTVIEPASVEMAESFWNALDVVARERRYLLFTKAPPLEKTREFVNEVIEKGGSQFYAIQSGRVIGWCDVLRYERVGMTHSGHLGIGILPDFRGKGLGLRLLEVTIRDFFAKGGVRIELEVLASNKRAVEIYRKFGFVEEGRKRNARVLDGVCDDFIVMALFHVDFN